jgi:hypothetical protein
MSAQHTPVAYLDETGTPVLLPRRRTWTGANGDKEYDRALHDARAYHGDGLLYAAADFDAVVAQRDKLLDALRRLSFAALCRDSTSGDPCRLIEVKAELAAAAKHADAAIAKVKGGAA